MSEYLAPGVYIEEIEIGAKPIEGVSTSTAGFLGLTERGPTKTPKLVTSLTQFIRIYGGYIPDSYLAYAVDGFFRNGGQRCFIGRIIRTGATSSSLPGIDLTFTAVGEGYWGDRVAIRIENATNDPDDANQDGEKLFKLTVTYWSRELPSFEIPDPPADLNRALRELIDRASRVEVFDNLSEDSNSVDHYLKKLGDPLNNLSNLVVLSGTGRPDNTDASIFFEALTGGLDAIGAPPGDVPPPTRGNFLGDPAALPGNKRGLTAFTDIDELSIVYVPDIHVVEAAGRGTLIDDILAHCEMLKDRFAILEVPVNTNDLSGLTITSVARPSKYGAIYYPWIKVFDPLTKQQKQIPPGGYLAGIYARSDTERGVHKAPANELVKGTIDLEFSITKEEQGILNPRGINVIRNFPGRGRLVWGARTAILDPLWKYINVRRLFLFIEESIEEGTQWVVFEPNNEKLWARVRQTITQFLTRVWKDGALMGTTPEEAFFVKCDRTTMTQDDIDNGRLIVLIGVAPVKPAEFVIFRIAQWAGGSAATE
ncbi:MAG: phage tail protein [Desulfobacterales bacterium S5133MH4]|nr:MAG: phage tail protein [Desulfobacterales bacterium S5133MH4]